MAGHSKWANIKRQKAVNDAKKGKVFTKLIREITVAARAGGGEPGANPRLRKAIDDALNENMTKETINRAIQRGVGGADGGEVEEVWYEGYGVGGVAVIVECLTDNRNRTVATVRHAFSKCGGNLGTDGSVSYLFKKQGILSFPNTVSEEKLFELALDAGAEDIQQEEDNWLVITAPETYSGVKNSLEKAGLKPDFAELSLIPDLTVKIDDPEMAEKVQRLLNMLDELDDVQAVYANADLSVFEEA